jgi:hypothetical protein
MRDGIAAFRTDPFGRPLEKSQSVRNAADPSRVGFGRDRSARPGLRLGSQVPGWAYVRAPLTACPESMCTHRVWLAKFNGCRRPCHICELRRTIPGGPRFRWSQTPGSRRKMPPFR